MSVRDLLLPSLLALVLGAGTAGLVACGDDPGDAGLLAPADAEQLLDDLDAARQALAGGECAEAAQAVAQARTSVEQLPASVNNRLVSRIEEGVNALETEIRPDCEEQTVEEPVTTTETTPTETEPSAETDTTPAEPEAPAQTDTQPVEPPAQTSPPSQTTPPDQGDGGDGTGGIAPGDDGGD